MTEFRRTWFGFAAFAAVVLMQPTIAAAQGAPAPGQVADTAVGQAGQRRTSDQVVPGNVPLDRLNGRINNRVQSRLRTRIDRFYDPAANATSPFRVAGEQARNPVRHTGR